MKRFLLISVFMYVVLLLHADTIFYINHTQLLTLKFPSEIKYVDVGSAQIEVRQLADARSLTVRARHENTTNSTLSVVTSNGKYHLYTLAYRHCLPFLGYQVEEGPLPSPIIAIGQEKTTHFMAPFPITDWSVGSDSIIAAYADGIQNMVRVKAVHPYLQEGSIVLVGKDGSIHTYRLKLNDGLPNKLVQLADSVPSEALFLSNPIDVNLLQQIGNQVLQQPYSMNHLGVVEHKMQFAVVGIYSYDDWLLFRLQIHNRNNIDYDIDFIKGYIVDKKGSKHTALQESEVTPFYTYNTDDVAGTLPAQHLQERVLFFQRFTLPKQRMLVFELFEKNGGRHLSFPILSKELLKAKQWIPTR
jgi:conjugative transposon TraN protein